ncbi:hypothetical protein Afer_2011 [Acidimicrobium ferrooxidans DSM 10331]|uniref:Uncharacterized protein n=1 Tax=Acidimicrobium ferrooxidans (strain DSM 10331 / JCM 15462 / NBRC 103882 / ICP) TaxID=525909 RepID=C7M2C4_ACIFD|nr:hypothetical protein Afer_2011 [Acidimicrobium ferrooxidans DSM 10331]
MVRTGVNRRGPARFVSLRRVYRPVGVGQATPQERRTNAILTAASRDSCRAARAVTPIVALRRSCVVSATVV